MLIFFCFFWILVFFFFFFFFFFQAEDGIRDADVTGVQTCALPIYTTRPSTCWPPGSRRRSTASLTDNARRPHEQPDPDHHEAAEAAKVVRLEIGRASCRERV